MNSSGEDAFIIYGNSENRKIMKSHIIYDQMTKWRDIVICSNGNAD